MIRIDETNFLIFAAKHYKLNNSVDTSDFEEDIARFIYIKKCFYIIKNKNSKNINIVLNHLRVLFNVFEEKALFRMLFYKLGDYLDMLLPCILYIGKKIPDVVSHVGINDCTIFTSDIPYDNNIILILRSLKK